jgi:hypothetical protein
VRRKLARGHRLVGGPCERVSRPASDSIDLLPLQGRNEPWPLDGVGAAVAKLALIIVTPGVHFTLLTNKYYSDNVFTFGRNVLKGLFYNLNEEKPDVVSVCSRLGYTYVLQLLFGEQLLTTQPPQKLKKT